MAKIVITIEDVAQGVEITRAVMTDGAENPTPANELADNLIDLLNAFARRRQRRCANGQVLH